MSTYFSATGEDAALSGTGGVTGGGTFISLHSASPGTTGANELSGGSYARVGTTWGTSSGGSNTGAAVTINVPSGGTVSYFGIWSAASSGSYIGGGSLSSTQVYLGSGTFVLTPTLTATG